MTIIEPGPTGHPARWWLADGDAVLCQLCPRRCRIPDRGTGFCHARTNVKGELRTLTYGRVCVSTVDPVEKKPIFHYRPGSRLFSVGTFGCNLDCDFCQNAVLARSFSAELPAKYVPPEELVRTAVEKRADGIGWTFNEPVVWSEYIADVSRLAHECGLFSLLNTNGYICGEARRDLLAHIDVVKVDIKGFDDPTYQAICQGHLAPVLDTCLTVKEKGIHLELAYPVIPGRTDDPGMLVKFADWVVDELGHETPVHLFRFQPAYRSMQLKSMERDKMYEIRKMVAGCGLHFVYLGGMIGEGQDTICPKCGAVVVSRRAVEADERVIVKQEQVSRFCPSYADIKILTIDGYCPKCGRSIPIHEKKESGYN